MFDGRFANNGWLQELPKPLTKLTWDNAALMSPKTAKELGISYVRRRRHMSVRRAASTDATSWRLVELTYRGRKIKAPVWMQPGHADDAITLHLGHGRQHAGHVAEGVGFNAYALRTADAPWFAGGLEAQLLSGMTHSLACTQMHQNMEERRYDPRPLGPVQNEPTLAQAATEPTTEAEQKQEKPDRRLIPLTFYTEGQKEFPDLAGRQHAGRVRRRFQCLRACVPGTPCGSTAAWKPASCREGAHAGLHSDAHNMEEQRPIRTTGALPRAIRASPTI